MDRRGLSRISIGLFAALVFLGTQSLDLRLAEAGSMPNDLTCTLDYPDPFQLIVVSDSTNPQGDLETFRTSGLAGQDVDLKDYLDGLINSAQKYTTSATGNDDWKPWDKGQGSDNLKSATAAIFFLEAKDDQEKDPSDDDATPAEATASNKFSALRVQADSDKWIVLSGRPDEWLDQYSKGRHSRDDGTVSVNQVAGQINVTSTLDNVVSEAFDVTWESGGKRQTCSSGRAPMSIPVGGDGTLTLKMVNQEIPEIVYSCKATSCTKVQNTPGEGSGSQTSPPSTLLPNDYKAPSEPSGESAETSVGALFGSLVVGLLIGAAGLFLLGRRQPQLFGAPPSAAGVAAVAPVSGAGPGAARSGQLTAGAVPLRPPPAESNGTGARPNVMPRPSKPGWTSVVANDASVRLEDVGLDRILPLNLPRGRSWGVFTDRFVAMSGWTEKIDGKGEDALPALRFHDTGRGLVAVFDGVGGAGAGVARRLGDGTELSGAFVSSRLVRATLESWTVGLVDRQHHVSDDDPERLAGLIRGVLADEAVHQPQNSVGLKGSLTRQMPTTMAAITFTEIADGVEVDALWAGDSRAYALSPLAGLQVLTVDDTRDTDAMSLIRNDMPMANLISADQPFTIHRHHVRLTKPTVLIAATDGCFGYVLTPSHFEFLTLQTMLDSPDVVSWASALVAELDAVAGDDVSFSVCGFGFNSWQDLQESFRQRCDYLRREHWDPFAGVSEDRERLEQFRDASWATYRDGYHALLQQDVPVR